MNIRLEFRDESAMIRAMPAISKYPIETKETAKALYLQGFTPAVIAVQLNVKPATINKWREHGQWVRIRDGTLDKVIARGMTVLTRETTGQLERASAKLREQFAGILQKGADALADVAVQPTSQSVREFAEAAEPLIRGAKVVHAWGNEGPSGMVLAELLGHEQDRHSTPVEIAACVEASCVSDTTTGSVPSTEPEQSTPQEEQGTINQQHGEQST